MFTAIHLPISVTLAKYWVRCYIIH